MSYLFRVIQCGVLLTCILGMSVIAMVLSGCKPSPQSFDDWFAEHQKTCPECGGGPDKPMCVKAFEKLQEDLRR